MALGSPKAHGVASSLSRATLCLYVFTRGTLCQTSGVVDSEFTFPQVFEKRTSSELCVSSCLLVTIAPGAGVRSLPGFLTFNSCSALTSHHIASL